jgi:hypothetical protein
MTEGDYYSQFLLLRKDGKYSEAYQQVLDGIKYCDQKLPFIFEAIRYCVWTENEEFNRQTILKLILEHLKTPYSMLINMILGYLVHDCSKKGYDTIIETLLIFSGVSKDSAKVILIEELSLFYLQTNNIQEMIRTLASNGHFRSQVQMYYITKELFWIDLARMQKYRFEDDLLPVVRDLQLRKARTRLAMKYTSFCLKNTVVKDKNLRRMIMNLIWTTRYDTDWKEKELRRSKRIKVSTF